MIKSLTITVIAAVHGVVNCTISLGKCPADGFPVEKNFDKERYAGRWYEQVRDKNMFFEKCAECTTADYDMLPNGDLSVYNRAWYWYFNKYVSMHGSARCPGTDGKCIVNFGGKNKSDRINYNILMTDYDNYSVVYSCYPITSWLKSEYFWILARTPEVDEDALK